jgi:predicted ATPase
LRFFEGVASGRASSSSTSRAALSPARQMEFWRVPDGAVDVCQVVMATHSPMLMAYPAHACCG